MTGAESSLTYVAPERANLRPVYVAIGRIILALILLLAWQVGAVHVGNLYAAPPIPVLQRIVTDVANGNLLLQTYYTLRLSVIGFAFGGGAGLLLPFLLRRMPRFTAAIEPFILASSGIPKYALMPLFILWFGVNDAPKLWLVGLLVFYVVFIAVFSGVRAVDIRLINMARVMGASETAISREVVWHSLLPFFFQALKIAMPRAVSAAIVGEILDGDRGLGFYISNARQQLDVTGVFAGLTASIVIVLAVNGVVGAIDKRVNRWRPVDRDMEI